MVRAAGATSIHYECFEPGPGVKFLANLRCYAPAVPGALSLALIAALVGSAEDAGEDPGAWKPAAAPPPTAWAQAGARPWRICDAAGRQALGIRLGTQGRGKFERVWRARARQCPHEPDVLVLAAQQAVLEAVPTGWMPESDPNLDDTIDAQRAAALEAIAFLDAAIEEAHLRGDQAPYEAHYFRAYAQSVLGEATAARESLALADAAGDAERYRIERMAAVAALHEGKLEDAVRLARMALDDAPMDADERSISRYVWALVLDRAGDSESARDVFRQLRREPGSLRARPAVETMLPAHERMFLRALEHQAHGESTNASRLWDAYLARPEPEEADRVLAQRHRDELR